MNIQLSGTEVRTAEQDSKQHNWANESQEFIDNKNTGTLGSVLIRCNNVLWISGAHGDGDDDMED